MNGAIKRTPGALARRLTALHSRWLARRMPASRQQRLNQRRIFILPTGYGLFFLAIAALLFIGGINYENNLIMALAFLMASLFMIAILHTFRNLAGLELSAGDMHPGFAAAQGALQIRLRAPGRHGHLSLWLRYPGGQREEVSVAGGAGQSVWLTVPLRRRGLHHPGRLRVESRYPLGLLCAWSLLDLDQRCLAWPRPLPGGECPHGDDPDEPAHSAVLRAGNDDFQGLRQYTESDPPRLVDWKVYARGLGLYSKQFAEPAQNLLWLDWAALPGQDTELRLSRLAWWVLTLSQQQQRYGLRLPGTELPPGRGNAHQRQALDALARFGE